MPNFLYSSYFSTKDNEGWSENFIVNATDIAAAASQASASIVHRMALSPNNVDMVFGKVSDVSIKGDSLIVLPATGTYPFIGTWAEDPTGAYLEANTALLIEIVTATGKKNRVFLRGLSLDVVTGREFKNPTGYEAALTTWMGDLAGSDRMVRTQNKPHTHPPTYTYTAASEAHFRHVTARKPGRPFGLPVGRKFAHRTA